MVSLILDQISVKAFYPDLIPQKKGGGGDSSSTTSFGSVSALRATLKTDSELETKWAHLQTLVSSVATRTEILPWNFLFR